MKDLDGYLGKWGNDVLYRMCRERPLHDDLDTVYSKLWIIGRSYTVAIERGAGKDFKIADAAKLIKGSDIDLWITDISKIDKPTESNIHIVLDAHKKLTDLLAKATNLEKRSLASKYLHFHSPESVFIYDSIARNKVRLKLREFGRSPKIKSRTQHPYDKEYASFSYLCLEFREILESKHVVEFNPRKLDSVLVEYDFINNKHST